MNKTFHEVDESEGLLNIPPPAEASDEYEKAEEKENATRTAIVSI
jgi:hypothetical protein